MPKVPDAVLHCIRCARCKKWLSCGPVILLPSGGSICGRCQIHKEGPRDQYRHFAFEALACYFKFPCKNWEKNCPESLPFKKVLHHEENCSYGSTCGTLFSHPSAAFKAKRQLDIRAAIKLEIIPDQVLEYLRCGNCAGYLSSSPIFVCRDGTSVCHRCSTQLQQPSPEFIRDPSFEVFVDMIIFPCIFRYRGCTQYFKFGEASWEHEMECPYGKPYSREQHRGRQQQEQAVRRQEPIQGGHKERGVIETHSGHIYATITPNAPVFARPTNRQEQEMFMDEFQRHRENLSSKWGRPSDDQPQVFQYPEPEHPRSSNSRYPGRGNSFAPADGAQRPSQLGRSNPHSPTYGGSPGSSQQGRPDSTYENMGFGNGLIDELRHKQHLKKAMPNGGYTNGDYDERRSSQLDDSNYYGREREPRKMEYSVYS